MLLKKNRSSMIESLESRRLMSVTVTEGFPGYYDIAMNDQTSLDVNINQLAETMTVNGTTTYQNVQHLTVQCNNLGDTVDVYAVNSGNNDAGCQITGGTGDDYLQLQGVSGSIHAGSGNDTIMLQNSFYGEAYGDDGTTNILVEGNCTGANIVGGNGGGTIDCRYSSTGVVVRGGTASTLIYGSDYADQLTGVSGSDTIFARGGNDTIYSNGGSVHGGAGTDQAYVTPGTYVFADCETVNYW